jgi:predicted transcriptional regulator
MKKSPEEKQQHALPRVTREKAIEQYIRLKKGGVEAGKGRHVTTSEAIAQSARLKRQSMRNSES